jgi:hypothetical protein
MSNMKIGIHSNTYTQPMFEGVLKRVLVAIVGHG